MAANAPKPASDTPKDGAAAKPPSEPAPSGGGGGQSWMPLIIAIVLMPALSFATTKFLILPKLQQPAETSKGTSAKSTSKTSGHGAKASKSHGSKDSSDKKTAVPLKKVLVNVRDTQGTRYLLANLTLIGAGEEFKNAVNEQQDQLVDVVSSALAGKTIGDLEKPGARAFVKTELLTIINGTLGEEIVQDIYFTEFVIQ